ncbi:conserved Plasmodium protein, unknown function [Plasmodium ovale]|uniref:Uncharacterized protein n=2 Tax=Plasmodium ovale TaxID=36330 RepID=A0A1A8WBJ7_PLAOA|nr:conserved Plasmodium protein, unknown function [Plasmodium ovale curtisi]SCQ17066.1 conserved Plasmodium protein, unknown function [Plasmodium ovale]
MKKKNLFLNKKHIKNKNFLRKKKKYFTDQKFLRKYKKSIQTNEAQTELVKSDPIKNFFFTPVKDAIREEKAETEANHTNETTEYYNKAHHTHSNDNSRGGNSEDDARGVEEKKQGREFNRCSSGDGETTVPGIHMRKKGKKLSIYSKEISLLSRKHEGVLSPQEKQAIFLQKEKERNEKKLIRYKKFKKLNQKTKRGQPIMKNIINHLLKKI